MSLTLKLSGFKSFTDPTTIPFASNLTAIVGPNGCGKSNIIDAMRWVLGEMSAKHMRGESMSDVIFNGSSNRKPLGQASVEMVLDNSSVRLGGEYAQYNEIAIRREVSRDGASSYYFNGTPCRRKDIMNMFLGTGLKYSIIEQGMVSEIIEANPEALRAYLEDAAGVSRYRERRKETESRIGHTKDNLARLADIRGEIENQIKVLKKQSNLAEVYRKLREELRLCKAKLHVVNWYFIDLKSREFLSAMQSEEIVLQEQVAKQREVEASLEVRRQLKVELNAALDEIQSRFYVLGSSIAQLEQRLQYSKERRVQLNADLEKLELSLRDVLQHKQNDTAQIELLQKDLLALQAQFDIANSEFAISEKDLLGAENELNIWRSSWDKFIENTSLVQQKLEVENNNLQHLAAKIKLESELLAKLESEAETLSFTEIEQEILALSEVDAEFRAKVEDLKDSMASVQQSISQARVGVQNAIDELSRERSNLQELQGKKSALESLQKHALGGSEQKVTDWLKENNLTKPRLAQELRVESGWEKAAEVVLGSYLEAVCHDDLHNLIPLLTSLQNIPGNELTFFISSSAQVPDIEKNVNKTTLADKITCSWAVSGMLAHVYIADDLERALNIRAGLAPHESVVTPDGIWLGAAWVRVPLKAGGKSGILHREQELRNLEEKISEKLNSIGRLEATLKSKQDELSDFESKQGQMQHEFHQIADRSGSVSSELNVKQANLIHLREMAQNLRDEITGHRETLAIAQNQAVASEKSLQQLCLERDSHENERRDRIQYRDQYKENLDRARGLANQRKEALDALNMKLGLNRNQVAFLSQSLQRAEKQLLDLSERRAEIEKTLQEVTAPVAELENELAGKLEHRLTIEKDLVLARTNVESVDNELRDMEKLRANYQEKVEQMREKLSQLRIEKQGLDVNAANHVTQINEFGYQLEPVLAEIMPEIERGELTEEMLNDKIERNNKRTDRLGPINLAATEEYNKQLERKQYLDAQNDDLLAALATLEDAIHKIDAETRTKLRETFEKVDANLRELFPKVFGGGRAELMLSGDGDILKAGVTIYAQPPGKRNSTIHLLSGGEKALTAVALLFAMFQINPAPFCLLDEVDAPFDDENVSRFCRLVKEMSKSIQFIYISHNKISMEMADRLLGVTMHEPGVSRIVSVDIDQAMKMAEQS